MLKKLRGCEPEPADDSPPAAEPKPVPDVAETMSADRQMARRYTAHLLRKLRGYGPPAPEPVADNPPPVVEPKPAPVAEAASVDRQMGRRYTAQLLKQLRGYGSPESPALEPKLAQVAEATPVYGPLPEADAKPPRAPVPTRPRPSEPPSLADVPLHRQTTYEAEARPAKAAPAPIPTVGEALRRASSGPLQQMMAQADAMNRLTQMFLAYLPPHLHDHAVLIRLDQEVWEVHTDSAGWATRLRYALHNIRETLGRHLDIPLPKPRIYVRPLVAPFQPRRSPVKPPEPNIQPPDTAYSSLDERLSAALARLATRIHPSASGPADDSPFET